MEAHGFNGLDMWPQLLAKGIRWIKIDIGVVTRESCETFSNSWNLTGDRSLCFVDKNVEYCCLGLSGDTGSRPFLLDNFNTTDDLISFLASPSNAAFLPHNPLPVGGDRALRIGLDIGGDPQSCLNVTICPSAPLYRNFLLNWAKVLANTDIAAYGSLDNEISGWFSDLDTYCSAFTCSGDDAIIDSLPFDSQSGASWTETQSRYTVLNDDQTTFASCCESDCWKNALIPTAKTPWLWYESTGQADFVSILTDWKNCPSLPPSRSTQPNTALVIVSNMAPEMFEVFSSPVGTLGRGVNIQIEGVGENTTAPWIVATSATDDGNENNTAWVLLATLNTYSDETLVYVTSTTPGLIPEPIQPPPALVMATSSPLISFTWAACTGDDEAISSTSSLRLLFLASSDGNARVILFNKTNGDLLTATSSSYEWNFHFNDTVSITSATIVCTSQPSADWLVNLSNAPCTLLTIISSSAEGGGVGEQLIILASSLSAPSLFLTSTVITDVNTPRADRGVTLAFTYNLHVQQTFSGIAIWATSANYTGWPSGGGEGTRAYLYGVGIDFDMKQMSFNITPTPPAAAAVVGGEKVFERIGLGALPRLTANVLNGESGFLLLTTDGTCDAALYENNADMWRCGLSLPRYDSNLFYAAFQTVPQLLQYDYGSLSDWKALINTNGARHLGICSRSIAHGKFERGTSTSGALMAWNISQDGSSNVSRVEFALLIAHDAGSKASIPSPQWLLCGLPETKVGLVWDSFSILSIQQLETLGESNF